MRMDAKIDMLHRSGLIGKTDNETGLSSRKSGESDARVGESEEEVSIIQHSTKIFIPNDPLA